MHFGLTIIGPEAATPVKLSRKAIRTQGAKNWRLNGELIHDPADEQGRFGKLDVGDIAILAFEGTEEPKHLTIVLVSARFDKKLYDELSSLDLFSGRESMHQIDENDIRRIIEATRREYDSSHPVELLLAADSVEEAIYGASSFKASVDKRSDGRGVLISKDSIRAQVASAADTGHLGEEIFNDWLMKTLPADSCFEWISESHARASYDFKIDSVQWGSEKCLVYVDVKTTKGPHENTFHMSMAELRWAALNGPYMIARISSVNESIVDLCILDGVSDFARNLIDDLEKVLPANVRIDSVEVSHENFLVVLQDRIKRIDVYDGA